MLKKIMNTEFVVCMLVKLKNSMGRELGYFSHGNHNVASTYISLHETNYTHNWKKRCSISINIQLENQLEYHEAKDYFL